MRCSQYPREKQLRFRTKVTTNSCKERSLRNCWIIKPRCRSSASINHVSLSRNKLIIDMCFRRSRRLRRHIYLFEEAYWRLHAKYRATSKFTQQLFGPSPAAKWKEWLRNNCAQNTASWWLHGLLKRKKACSLQWRHNQQPFKISAKYLSSTIACDPETIGQ